MMAEVVPLRFIIPDRAEWSRHIERAAEQFVELNVVGDPALDLDSYSVSGGSDRQAVQRSVYWVKSSSDRGVRHQVVVESPVGDGSVFRNPPKPDGHDAHEGATMAVSCNCEAGLYARPCWHLAAVLVRSGAFGDIDDARFALAQSRMEL